MTDPPNDLVSSAEGSGLADCPFCGGAAQINQIGNEHTRKRGFEVCCVTWGCKTKKRAMVLRHSLEKAREFAIAAWNRRTSDDALTSRDARIAMLEQDVIAFCAPWAVRYARDHGLPDGHLHPTHYDILERAGARMDDFTRAALSPSQPTGGETS